MLHKEQLNVYLWAYSMTKSTLVELVNAQYECDIPLSRSFLGLEIQIFMLNGHFLFRTTVYHSEQHITVLFSTNLCVSYFALTSQERQ